VQHRFSRDLFSLQSLFLLRRFHKVVMGMNTGARSGSPLGGQRFENLETGSALNDGAGSPEFFISRFPKKV